MLLDELLTRWSIRIALTLYVLALVLRLSGVGQRSWWAAARVAWTAGCLVFLLHVACAFGFYHHWSHRRAYDETARQTAEVVGLDWGGGLYANYAFTIIWMADAGWWWWRGLERYSARPRLVEWAIQGWMAFIAINGTVVFGTGPIRWFGLTACVILVVLSLYRISHR